MDLLTGVLGVTTGLGNLFSNQSANAQKQEALSRYRKRLIDAKYDPVEKSRELDTLGDTFNTGIVNNENNSAFGLGRFLNSNTAKAVSEAKMLGQRSGAIADRSFQIDQYNKKIDMAIAESELNTPISDPIGDLITGGAAGIQLGMSIGNYQDQLDWNKLLKEKIDELGIGNTVAIKNSSARGGWF